MDLAHTNAEVVKLRERTAGNTKDIAEHDKDIRELDRRIRAVEVKVAVICAVSACGGGVVGGFFSKFLQ